MVEVKLKYPLVTSTWDENELNAIQRVITSGRFTMGEEVQRFEQEFAAFLGSKYCVMVNSGSSANLLAISSFFYRKKNPLQRGDEVIVPAIAWATSYYPLYQYGLRLKFVDIDRDTFNYDINALRKAVSNKTRAIMVVNLMGNPNDFNAINEIIGKRDIILIEDNCESMGAEYEGKQAGTLGLIGTFSTFFTHHMSTMEGGMAVTDEEELYHILLALRAHGWTRQLPKKNKVCSTKSKDTFKESFRFILPGYNVRPLELSGALGTEQLKKLPTFIKARRENAIFFQELFRNNPFFNIQKELGKSSWFGFALIKREGVLLTRSKIVQALQSNGIECRPIMTGDFTKTEVVKWFDYEIHGSLTAASWIDKNGFFVGNHHYPIKERIKLLKRVIDNLIKE